jgi:SNF2 family DNA or RNA helicase
MTPWGAIEYTFERKKNDLLHRILAHSSIRYEAEAADLPRVVEIRKSVVLPTDAHSYYDQAKAAIIASKGNIVEMRNMFLRMRQISSGYVGYKDDETGEKAEFVFDTNPKLELLTSIVSEIRPDRKIIVFHDFIFSGKRIAEELSREKVDFVQVWGQSKDPEGEIQRFQNDPRYRVLILNNSMVMGLNVQAASYGIFYESPLSVIMRKQARRRIERQFSEHSKVFIYDLVVRGTVDERILEFHRLGKDLFQAIIEGGPAVLFK